MRIQGGQVPVAFPRRSESHWDFSFKKDEALGPHFILQKGTQCLFLYPETEEENKALLDMFMEW